MSSLPEVGTVWFKVETWKGPDTIRIETVTALRHTDLSVWIKEWPECGKRISRMGSCCAYFPTYDEAERYLRAHLQVEMETAQSRMEFYADKMNSFRVALEKDTY